MAAGGRAAPGAAGPGASMPPPFFSAVSATMAPATPGIALTTRSAAARSGSISCARAAGTVIEKNTLLSAMKMSETSPRSTMLPVKSGPFTVFRRSRTASLVTGMAAASSLALASDSRFCWEHQAAKRHASACWRSHVGTINAQASLESRPLQEPCGADSGYRQMSEEVNMLGKTNATANIAVKDLATAKKFYESTLGLAPVRPRRRRSGRV